MIDLLTSRDMGIYLLVFLTWPAAIVAIAVLSHVMPPPAGEHLLRLPGNLEAADRPAAPIHGGRDPVCLRQTWNASARSPTALREIFASCSAEYARRAEEAITRIRI
jgi:hypothetical protein